MDIKPVSYIWRRVLQENALPKHGVIVEVAPGYEKKIGDALALLGFSGTVILIEPDKKAATHVGKLYRRIMPKASVKIVTKFLQDVRIGKDIPPHVDALLANHPFDDMAIAFALHGRDASFFTKEQKSGMDIAPDAKKLYNSLSDRDYIHGILATVVAWKDFVQKLKPDLFIVSQYPSIELTIKKLTKRQNSGFIAIELMRDYYENYLKQLYRDRSFGRQGDPAWWIIARKPYTDLLSDLAAKPEAMKRLERAIFVPQRARRLNSGEYDMVYVDRKYFRDAGYEGDPMQQARNFAIMLDHGKKKPDEITAYADRQKDSTGIGLTGNIGSGRAVYYGKRFNVLGVGKTSLCTSTVPSHSTGTLEIVGALRRIVLSRWISRFTDTTVRHLALIALKKTTSVHWNSDPIPLSLLVRIDDGALDRPSHIEYAPKIKNDFRKTLAAYAKLDAQYFAYRIMLGAWSTGNYSLSGHMIDLESASFVKYRGPYNTSSVKYPHNYFGYEGLGFVNILRQMANVKKMRATDVEKSFYEERRKQMAACFLSLLGVDDARSAPFLARHGGEVAKMADAFERLAKKITPDITNLNLYRPISEDGDPALLDMSNLFRNLKKLYRAPDREKKAMRYLIRKNALRKIKPGARDARRPSRPDGTDSGERHLRENAVVAYGMLPRFLSQTRNFVHCLFRLLEKLNAERCLPEGSHWNEALRTMNQDFPPMDVLNGKLKYWVEKYRTHRISPEMLGAEIEKLCVLPDYPTGEDFAFKNIPLIDYLKPNRRDRRMLCRYFETADYGKGDIIVRERDAADSLFILVQGTCRVSLNGAKIATIGDRGAIIGEAAVFERKPRKRTATVMAETPVRLLRIRRRNLKKLYAAYPRLGRLLANFLVQRKNGIGDKVLSLGVMNGIDPEIARIFFADKAVLKKLRSGERLIEQGKKTAGVYAVMRGSVALDQTGSCAQTDPIELDDTSLTQGLFGERSVIMNEGAVCTVTAKRNVTTLFVHKRDFREFLDRYPQLLRNCLDRITDYSRSNEKRASLIAALKKRMSPS